MKSNCDIKEIENIFYQKLKVKMSRFENLANQENLHVRPGKGLTTRGQDVKSLTNRSQGRVVLGEISQNITARRQPLRAAKQPEKSAFTIFCDENAGVSNPKAVSKALPKVVDKENVLPPNSNLGTVKVVDSFSSDSSDSSDCMDLESPMLLDTSVQQLDWRVPPLAQHKPESVDLFSVPEYSEDIYTYLRQSEIKYMAKHNYMTKQPDINQSMRTILVDWLVEVGEEYKLQTETLYLAVSYIDRFLSYMSVQRAKLQLVGTAAMFIASKYEEIYPPDVGEFVYITDDTYNKRQVLRMEHLVLKVLGFDLSGPTANVFLSQMCQWSQSPEKIQHLAMYLCELSLLDGETFLVYQPSLVAAASLCLARHALSRESPIEETWPEQLAKLTGYPCEDLKECVMSLHSAWSQAGDSTQQAVRDKYRSSKYHGVSDLEVPTLR